MTVDLSSLAEAVEDALEDHPGNMHVSQEYYDLGSTSRVFFIRTETLDGFYIEIRKAAE